MTIFLLLIILVLLCYLMKTVTHGEKEKQTVKDQPSLNYQAILPQYLKKNCSIILKKPLASLDAMYSIEGVLCDLDDEWLLIETMTKRKTIVRILRIDTIQSIKEIID